MYKKMLALSLLVMSASVSSVVAKCGSKCGKKDCKVAVKAIPVPKAPKVEAPRIKCGNCRKESCHNKAMNPVVIARAVKVRAPKVAKVEAPKMHCGRCGKCKNPVLQVPVLAAKRAATKAPVVVAEVVAPQAVVPVEPMVVAEEVVAPMEATVVVEQESALLEEEVVVEQRHVLQAAALETINQAMRHVSAAEAVLSGDDKAVCQQTVAFLNSLIRNEITSPEVITANLEKAVIDLSQVAEGLMAADAVNNVEVAAALIDAKDLIETMFE